MRLVFSRKMRVSVTYVEETRHTFCLKSLISDGVIVNVVEIIPWRRQHALQQPEGWCRISRA